MSRHPVQYVSFCCGAVFSPTYGPENIVPDPPSDKHDAVRMGECPACHEVFPSLDEWEPV